MSRSFAALRAAVRPFALCCLLALPFQPPAQAQGGPPGAAAFGFLFDPSTPELLYAATDAGVFRSDNAGQSWAAKSEGLGTANLSALAGGGSVLVAATTGAGIFRSNNGGDSWQAVNEGLGDLVILSLAIDPMESRIVYAGGSEGAIFKSDDGGGHWTPISAGLAEGFYLAIAVDPKNPNTVYAANASLTTPGLGRLFKTTNGGTQWSAVGAGIVPLSLAIDPSNSNILYIGTSNGITRSTDGGQSADPVRLAGASISGITIDPGDSKIVYVTTRIQGVFKSLDSGVTWAPASEGFPLAEFLAISADPAKPGRLYAGTNGVGVFRSLDSAATWKLASNGMGAGDITGLAVNPQNSSEVMAGVNGGNLFRSVNGGDSWDESRRDLFLRAIFALAYDPSNPSTIYAGSVNPLNTRDGALVKSTDGGAQWQVLAVQVPVYSLAIDPSQTQTVYVGLEGGLFKSTNGGQNFSPANSISGGQGDSLQFWTIQDLAIDPNNARTIYTVVSDSSGRGQVLKTTNAADNWRSLGFSNSAPLLAVAVDPRDSRRVYVGSPLGITRSTNSGDSFAAANTGLPTNVPITVLSLAIDANENSAIYAATAAGVFKSVNRGDSWSLADTGLENFIVRVLRVDPRNARVVYAATLGGGVFKTVDGGATWIPTSPFVGSDPIISRTSIVGAAGFEGSGVSPGEIVAIFGRDIGPAVGVQPGFDPGSGKLPTQAGGVTVFFGDVAAPLFFVREDQINAQVPFEVAGLDTVGVRVAVDGKTSNTAPLSVLPSHPGVFDFIGNQNLTRNSAANPESPGNVIILAVTGTGLFNPALMTGQPAPAAPFSEPLLPLELTIGGQPAPIEFKGAAQGFVGLVQINARIPLGLPSGPQPVLLKAGTLASGTPAIVHVR